MKMQRRERVCRHCKEPYGTRLGRGLCSSCWRNPIIREGYPPLAKFGGGEASAFATSKAKDQV